MADVVPIRLVELLGALSLACDAADGFAPETTLRSAVLATGLARRWGLDETGVLDVLHGALLRHVGCTGFAVEEANEYGAGDDVGLRRVMATVDFGQPDDAYRRMTTGVAAHASAADRDAALGNLLGGGAAVGEAHHAAQCDAGERLAELLPVPIGARAVPSEAFERWDGGGSPYGLVGPELSIVSRVVEVAYVAELFRSREGVAGCRAALRSRAGGALDPEVVRVFLEHGEELLGAVTDPRVAVWDQLLEAEPEPGLWISAAQVDAVATAFARFTDLKSPWFTGHSEAVARLAGVAGERFGLGSDACSRLHVAGLVHDLGRVGIPTGTWELPRSLSPPERDRVRSHAGETARILAATPLFADIAAIAGATHERLDGSGYHRGLAATVLDGSARLLAAADVACALAEARPHRPALTPIEAHAVLAAETAAGRLDRDAVAAVLDAGGGPLPVALRWPASLSDREVEVLRLVATGATNKDIARALGITAKTVAHHVAHAYTKTGCRSRAGATLFALEHGLVGPGTASATFPI